MNYSKVQEQAIHQHEGQVILVSCPGSGKTSTVIARVADMVKNGIDPCSILVVTFTQAAAKEMGSRYEKLAGMGEGCGRVTFSTIHSFCFSILRRMHGYTNANVVTDNEKWDYISTVVKELRKQGILRMEIRDFTDFIQSCILEISVVANDPYHDWETYKSTTIRDKGAFRMLYDGYQELKHRDVKIDYDDMLVLVNSLFTTQPGILMDCQARYRYLIIDEFQDTNYLQRDLLYKLAGENPNICVVGDDDQSIYKFRGAHPEIMLGFKKTFPGCKELYMDVNYRSEPEIVQAAKNVIQNNKIRFQKDIKPNKTGTGTVKVYSYEDRKEEYQKTIDRIKVLHSKGEPYENMAVLFRNNEHSQGWATACKAADIPFHSTEKIKSRYEHWIFKDIQAYYNIANGTGSIYDLRHIINKPQRYLPAARIHAADRAHMMQVIQSDKNIEDWKLKSAREKIDKFFRDLESMKGQSPYDFLLILRKAAGYDGYLKNYAEYRNKEQAEYRDVMDFFMTEAKEYDTFEDWYLHIDQYNREVEELNRKTQDEGILLSTMHKAKGLEWPIVFVVHANDNVIPSSQSSKQEDIEEERRLFYVALTRAKEQLYVSSFDRFRSRFVSEMISGREKKREEAKGTGKDVLRRIKRKDTVKHAELGVGTVLDIQGGDVLVKYRKGTELIRHKASDFGDGGIVTLL